MTLPSVCLRAILCACCLSSSLAGREPAVSIADFDGENPLASWAFSRDDRANGSLQLGPGHSGKGALLEYRFDRGGGAAAAVWTPPKPVPVKKGGALSLWIRAGAEVKLTLLLKDNDRQTRRYPFEAATLERPAGGDWRHVVIPLAAKSLGYGDEDHSGAPKNRAASIGILAEPRYPQAMRGSLSFDDLEMLDSPDQIFTLRTDAPLLPAPAAAAQLAPRLGVAIHILNDEHLLDLAHEAGFTFVRADLLWSQVERNGRYRFFTYDRLLSALDARGMGALWILDYGHPQHGGDPPRTRDDVAAFARFAEATAAHFKGRNVRYEIWNEPNIERFWQPRPNAVEYASLLREAADAIRRADPAARVSSGGLARMDLPFLAQTIAAGGAAQVNAAAVHPYYKSGPESVAADLTLLRRLLTSTLGEQVEIWDTEWGYASYDYFSQNLRGDGHSAPGRKRQADLAAREALTVWALGLPVAVWYDLRDDGEDPRNPEHNYGLLDPKNAAKPAMTAINALMRAARDRTYAGMLPDLADGTHAMRIDGKSDRIFAIWSEQPDARITMQFSMEGFVSATNLTGETLKFKTRGHNEAELPLIEADGPVYLEFRSR